MNLNNYSIRSKIILANSISLLFFILITIFIYINITSITDSSQWIHKVEKNISEANLIAKLVVDMETGMRGFIITGKEEFLEPYNKAKFLLETHITSLINEVKILSDENKSEKIKLLNQIKQLVEKWQKDISNIKISLRRKLNESDKITEYLKSILQKAEGKKIMIALHDTIEQLNKTFIQNKNKQGQILLLSIQKTFLLMETNQRGFIITGKEDFLDTFNKYNNFFPKLMIKMSKIFHQNPEIENKLNLIKKFIKKWLEIAAGPEIHAKKEMKKTTESLNDIIEIVASAKGKQIIDEIRYKLETFKSLEEEQLIQKKQIMQFNQKHARKMIILACIAILINIFIAFISAFIIARKISQPINDLVIVLKGMSKGDISKTVTLSGSYEAAQLGHSFNEMVKNLQNIASQANSIAKGDYSRNIKPLSKKDELGFAMQQMTITLRKITQENEQQLWFKTGQTKLNEKISGKQKLLDLTQNTINFLVNYLDGQIGAIYVYENYTLKLKGSYAYTKRKQKFKDYVNRKEKTITYKLGESLVGQAAMEMKSIICTDIPDDYFCISSGFCEVKPENIAIVPLLYENKVNGVIEIGSSQEFKETHIAYLEDVAKNIAIAIHMAKSNI